MTEEGRSQVADEGGITDWTLLLFFLSRKTESAYKFCICSTHQINSSPDKAEIQNHRNTLRSISRWTVTENPSRVSSSQKGI